MQRKFLLFAGIVSLLASAFWIVACGKNKSVTGTTSGEELTKYLSGYDGSPVAAQVSGSANTLTVSAPGFLTLDTVDRHRSVYLFPNNNTMTLLDTFQYVYGSSEANALSRIGDSVHVIGVVARGALAADGPTVDAMQQGIAQDNALLVSAGVNTTFVLGDEGQLTVTLDFKPTDPICAAGAGGATYNTNRGNLRVSSRIVVCSIEQARMQITWAHELVHVIGLGHSVHTGPMMNSAELYLHQEFVPLDVQYASMLFRREPGTRFTFAAQRENDRSALSASDAATSTSKVECKF